MRFGFLISTVLDWRLLQVELETEREVNHWSNAKNSWYSYHARVDFLAQIIIPVLLSLGINPSL